MKMSLKGFCGSHKTHMGWTLGTLVGVLTILSLLGLLPWATQASLKKTEDGLEKRLDRIEQKVDLLLRR